MCTIYAHVYDNDTEQGLAHLKGLSTTALAPVGGGLPLFTEMPRRLVSLVKVASGAVGGPEPGLKCPRMELSAPKQESERVTKEFFNKSQRSRKPV